MEPTGTPVSTRPGQLHLTRSELRRDCSVRVSSQGAAVVICGASPRRRNALTVGCSYPGRAMFESTRTDRWELRFPRFARCCRRPGWSGSETRPSPSARGNAGTTGFPRSCFCGWRDVADDDSAVALVDAGSRLRALRTEARGGRTIAGEDSRGGARAPAVELSAPRQLQALGAFVVTGTETAKLAGTRAR